MENKRYSRTIQIIGEDNFNKIRDKKIIVFGVGGVGGQALEALVRAGFKHLTIVDFDVVEESNLNRQLVSTLSKIGKSKVDAAKERMDDIMPDLEISAHYAAVNAENIGTYNLELYDYIVDAIDSFDDKMALIKYALSNNLPIISAMGAGNRLDPTKVYVTKVEKTEGCPLAKKVRYFLRKENLKELNVVSSKELPMENTGVRPGSSPFVPPAYGLAIASFIFQEIVKG